jgi:hypothetical protein
MKEINKDIVKETSNRLLGLCENNPAAYKCMIELSSNRRIDPSNGFGPLAVVTLHLRHKRQQNKSVVQLNMSRQHCQTNSHFKSCTVGVDL